MNQIKALKVAKLLLVYRCLYLFSCYWRLNEKKNDTDTPPEAETESRPKTESGGFSEKSEIASDAEPWQAKYSSETTKFLASNLRQGDYINPVNFMDPFGKWNIDVHTEITREAINKVSSNWDYWQWKEFRKALARGSRLPDYPEGKIAVAKAWIVYKLGGKTWTRSFRTHYGDLAAWHAMRYGNQTRKEVIEAMKFFIMTRAVTAKTMLLQGLRDRSLPNYKRRELIRQAGLMLGLTLHIIEDSYARGHTERNENMEIVQSFDYEEQQKSKEAKEFHAAGDKKKGNEKYFKEAVASVARVLELFDRSSSVDEFAAELEKLLDTYVFILQNLKKRI